MINRDSKVNKLISFLKETISYFALKLEGVDRDRYFADRDIRNILDKSINDIILCIVDLCEELLKKYKREIPDSYKDTVLACYEFIGEIALKIAPLTRHRNELIHQYLKINWQNVVTLKNRIADVEEFLEKISNAFAEKC